jgi:Zn finger protein HypA/HybF involved in hydrogenase expression
MAVTIRVSCLECDCTCLVEVEPSWDIRYCPSCGSKVEVDEDDVVHEDLNFDDWDD